MIALMAASAQGYSYSMSLCSEDLSSGRTWELVCRVVSLYSMCGFKAPTSSLGKLAQGDYKPVAGDLYQ